MAFYIRGSQETERLVPSVPVVIFGSGGNNESCFSPALSCESELTPGTCPLGRPVGILCVSPLATSHVDPVDLLSPRFRGGGRVMRLSLGKLLLVDLLQVIKRTN